MYTGFLEERHIEMEDFDNLSISHTARAELEKIKEPHRRRILENFIEHAEAETTGNYEALIESCSAKTQTYAVYGCNEFQKSIQPQDVESMKEFYHMLVASLCSTSFTLVRSFRRRLVLNSVKKVRFTS